MFSLHSLIGETTALYVENEHCVYQKRTVFRITVSAIKW